MEVLQPVEDILAPMVRYLRDSELMKECAQTIPEFGINPLLGPPEWILSPEDGGLVLNPNPGELWIFRNEDGVPWAHVEGSGSSSITLAHNAAHTQDKSGSGRIFPEIMVYYHCDVSRGDELGAPIAQDGRDRCLTLHKRMKRLFDSDFINHRSWLLMGPKYDGRSALRVASMYPGRSLTIQEVPNGDGMVVGSASFEFEILI